MTNFISAHRGGSSTYPENSKEAIGAAIESGVDFVEFDVQPLGDGTLVLHHDATVSTRAGKQPLTALDLAQFRTAMPHALTYAEALHLLQGTGVRAHIDLKGHSAPGEHPWELEAAKQAVDVLGPENCILTSLEDHSVRVIRQWSRSAHPDLLVGLSLGRDLTGMGLAKKIRTRASELFPAARFRATSANLVVANHRLASVTLWRWARRKGLPLLLWTVDHHIDLRHWMSRGDVFAITTNHPLKALPERKRLAARAEKARAGQ